MSLHRSLLLYWLTIFLPPVISKARPRSHHHVTGRHPRAQKRRSCFHTDECKGIHPDENEGCIDKCVSERCWTEVYDEGRAALEPGEVDPVKRQAFNKCLAVEDQEERDKKAQEL